MPSYLLDTDVIIDVLNDKRDAAAMPRGLIPDGHSLGCCAVGVFAAARPAEERTVAQFLGSLDYHAITPAIARRAGSDTGYEEHPPFAHAATAATPAGHLNSAAIARWTASGHARRKSYGECRT